MSSVSTSPQPSRTARTGRHWRIPPSRPAQRWKVFQAWVRRIPPSRWLSVLRVRNWRVRGKLAAVLLVPAVAFLIVTGLGTASSIRDALALEDFSAQVELGQRVTTLVHELQWERDHVAGYLAVVSRDTQTATQLAESITAQRSAVDNAVARYRQAAAPLAEQVRQIRRAEAALEQLDVVRTAVQQGWLRRESVFDEYSRIIAALLEVLPRAEAPGGSENNDGETVNQAVGTVRNLAQAKELASQIRGQLYAIAYSGGFAFGGFQQFADLRARYASAMDRFQSEAGAEQLTVYQNLVRGQATLAAERIEQAAVDGAQRGELDIDPEQWWAASTTALELVALAEQRLLSDAISLASNLTDAEWRDTWFSVGRVVVILLFALLVSFAVGRSMANSLRQLRAQALDVARHQLPEVIETLRTTPRGDLVLEPTPINMDSRDEIGEVAAAFDAVHREAVRLAAEQAVLRRNVSAMFINLARRSQVLVERQLQLVDRLEETEQDPEQLENLFQLDHLATRMRRNDESLLVLAGSESSRRWNRPIPLSQVFLAATAEIEQYPRVRYSVSDEISIVGHAVAELVHLLAELLENATAFSPPDTDVWLRGQLTRGGTEAVITVEDKGIGITPEELAEANERLAKPPVIDVSVSERMGLFVVSHLAARHGITVKLSSSPRSGTTAAVWLPADLLSYGPTPQPDLPPVPPRRAFVRRAEHLLGAQEEERQPAWWTQDESAWEHTSTPLSPTLTPAPDTGQRTSAGLPKRTPMAHVTAYARGATPRTQETPPPSSPFTRGRVPMSAAAAWAPEPEPDEVASTLSQFYAGIRRADAEATEGLSY